MRTVVDHALSLLLLLGMLVEFVWVKQAATATFFLMLVIALSRCRRVRRLAALAGAAARAGDRA